LLLAALQFSASSDTGGKGAGKGLERGGKHVTTSVERNPRQPTIVWDSLNSDLVEVTETEVDTTVRPMRESLRKLLEKRAGLNSTGQPDKPANTNS
jgi:hypothetical protein